jgi:hypothetical protein
MKSGLLPSASEVTRSAALMIGAALLAALILSRLPTLRDYIRANSPL